MEIKGPEFTEKYKTIGLVLLGVVLVAILFRPKQAKAETTAVSQTITTEIEPVIDPTKPLAERIKDLQARLGINW